jgi:nucleotide-binding universal stress UspA family protein
MLPIRTILHPTDFSEQSAYAFEVACSLARDYGARLLLLHVQPLGVVYGGELNALPPYPTVARQELHARLCQLQPPHPSLPVDRLVLEGLPAAEIVAMAEKIPCDLIVMGTHGRTGLGRMVMGSVAEQVVRKASCPVLTVKSPLSETVSVSDRGQELATTAKHAMR